MQPTQLYARLRARFAAGVGQFRDTILPRHATPAGTTRRMSSPRKHQGDAQQPR
jgi:hypothetical protein